MKKLLFGLISFISVNAFGQTFSNGTTYAIPDNNVSGVYSDIVVSGIPPTAILSDVTINITHTWDSDLDIYIVDPLNNEHLLSSNNGGSGDNYTATHFTRTAGLSITSGSAPFSGYFLPQTPPLPGNVNPNGTWRLHVEDWVSGDIGNIVSWSVTFTAPTCPTVGFHADGYSPTLIPPTVYCNSVDTFLFANDSSIANGPIYPTLYFQFNTHANGTLNGITIYEDGSPIYSDASLDINTELTVYATGAFMSPTSLYTIQVCNNGGTAAMEWVVYDGNGFTHGTGTTPSGCTTYGPWSPQGSGIWSIVPATAGFSSWDWGVARFRPSVAGTGTYNITYTWDNQGTGAYHCTGSQTQTITVNNPWNGAWTSPGTVCASNGSFSLNSYITGNTGGTWSGSGVSGSNFNPSGLSGSINVTYTVGSSISCRSQVTQAINVTPLGTAEAGPPASICSGLSHTISGASYGGSATSVLWSTSGSGSFTNASTTTPTYTPSAADITAGSVTLTITASGPCAAVTDFMVLSITGLDNASFNYSSGTFCQSGTNPTPTIVTPGGTFTSSPAGLSINATTGTINLGASTANITYTVTYTTIGACSNSSSATIDILSGFDASFTYAGPYCQSGSNPSPIFTTGSAGTFSVVPAGLNFASTSTGVIDLATSSSGTYTVTNFIPASGSCASASSTSSVTINESPLVTAGIDANICAGSTYALTGTMGGSAGMITWSGSGDGSFSDINSITATYTPGPTDITNGTVTLTITSDDPTGPCLPASDNIVLTIFTTPLVTAGTDAIICSNETYILAGTMSGSATSVTWSSSGTGSFDDATLLAATYTPSATDITAGTVTLTISSNDPAGPCNAVSDFLILTISTVPTVTAANDTALCSGIIVPVSGTVGGGATSATWSSSGSGIFANASNLSTTYTPSPADITAGSVTLTLTTNDPAGSCTATSDQLILTINPSPVLDSIVTTDVTTCSTPNGTISIYAHGGSGALQYSIDGGTIFSGTINFTGLNVNIYNIAVQDANLCQVSGQGTIITASNIGPNITSIDVTQIACYGGSTGTVTIHAEGAVLFSFNGGPLGSDSTFTGLSAGVYNIVVEDAGSCQDVGQVTITQNPALQLDSNIVNISCGNAGTAIIVVNGGLAPYTFNWSNDPNNHIYIAANLAAGNYICTVTDNAVCQASILVTVGITYSAGTSVILSQTDVSCFGLSNGSASVAMTNGIAPYTYQWSNNPLNLTSTATGLSMDTYTVTINDNTACTSILTVNITQPPILDASVTTNGNTCFGLQNGTALASATGGTIPYSFHWSNNQNAAGATGLAQGNYSVTITDSHNCKDSVLNVGITESPVLVVGASTTNPTCGNIHDGLISVHVTGGTNPYFYAWSDLQTDSIADNLAAGTYTLTVTDNYGCSDTLVYLLSQPSGMVATYFATTTSCFENIDGAINLVVANGRPPYMFLWSNTKTTEDISDLEGAIYTVTITDSLGCVITLDATVPKGQSECFEIPSAFTPNADGSNDKWEFKNMSLYQEISVEVYNRWGALVFKSDKYAQEPWDGTYNGKDVPAGTYVYIIKQNSTKDPVNGSVTIIR